MSGKQNYGDELQEWSEMANCLCMIKMANDWGKQYCDRFKRFMPKADQVELASLTSRLDGLYWRSWEKLIKKIRGL